ncbi:hypothetical protein [Ruminococcus flavefaciens]|uniref:hypothetical protein n=1 Tax=Ruminococcus flavefaciens TaxID=1265 RepID=UPI0026EC9F68|nr:hypothetical protein [Ruminococcus flavefaciens]
MDTPVNANSPEELADLIDRLMSQGSGHVNIISGENGTELKVDTVKSTDMCGTKGACCQPTENAIDEEE